MSDYISREAAIVLLKKWADGYSYIETPTEDAINEFNAIPAADVRPVVRGHWIIHRSDIFPADGTMECDQCHEEQPLTCDDNFCPNCGAKMGVQP